jgi:hypothetical protein
LARCLDHRHKLLTRTFGILNTGFAVSALQAKVGWQNVGKNTLGRRASSMAPEINCEDLDDTVGVVLGSFGARRVA